MHIVASFLILIMSIIFAWRSFKEKDADMIRVYAFISGTLISICLMR